MLGSELQNSELGHHLDAQEMKTIVSRNKVVVFAAGEVILQQGKQASGIYIILTGTVIVSAKVLGESIENMNTLGSGNFLGEISFLESVPCTMSVIANEEVKCLFISPVYFEFITAYFPETKYKILSVVTKQACERMKIMYDKITAFITRSDMTTRSFFSEVIQSLAKPEPISYQESKTHREQLQDLALFKLFTKTEIEEVLQHAVLLKAPKNCYLIDEKEKNPACYIVLYGAVQSSIVQNNKVAKLSVIGPVNLFASTSCGYHDSTFAITFSTCESAILLHLPKSVLDHFQKNHPQLWYKLFTLICKSLVALERSVAKLDVRLKTEEYNR